ncbi:MAG: WYL domain-containing protein [Actinomycetota bacterium]|nr:WYL domain-containing protein [Actinomycetota bacterium]
MQALERLVNLVALLLNSRQPVSFEWIRAELPAYEQDDLTSAKRMFERDKDALREIGIPIELRATDVWEVDEGYFIDKDRYYLPEIDFTPEEVSALFVAALAPGEQDAAEEGVRKLVVGVDASALGELSSRPVALGPGGGGARLGAIAGAIQGRRAIRFGYRDARGEDSRREIDPYGLVARAGQWYVVGFDHVRKEVRAFRLSRFASDVSDAGEGSAPPEGFGAAEHVTSGPWESEPGMEDATAVVALSPDVAWWASGSDAKVAADGWTRSRIEVRNRETFLAWVLSLGPDAEVLEPPELRSAVVARLEELRAAG